jgi:hypothetical protein
MSYFRRLAPMLCASLMCWAQTPEVSIEEPKQLPIIGPLLRPFHIQRRVIAPAVLTNTPRLESLVRGGNLYLSVQDVIAVTLENNLDIAIQRYAPYLAREVTAASSEREPLARRGPANQRRGRKASA